MTNFSINTHPLGLLAQSSVTYTNIINTTIQVSPLIVLTCNSTLGVVLVHQSRKGTNLSNEKFTLSYIRDYLSDSVIEGLGGLKTQTNISTIVNNTYINTHQYFNLFHKIPHISTYTSYIYNELTYTANSNQIVTVPSNRELNFGTLTSNKTLQLIIINHGIQPITLISHYVPSNFGCELSNLPVGYTILPGAQATLYITAKLLLGDPLINEFCPILFSNDVTIWVHVNILRQPSTVYSMAPDRDSYTESYLFKTNIFSSTSGKEKRVMLMDRPKLNIKYSVTPTTTAEASFINNNLYVGLFDIMYQPRWSFVTRTTSEVVGSILIPCNTYYGIFEVNDFCALYVTETEVILAKIVSVSPTSLTIFNPVNLPNNAYVIPVVACKPISGLSNNTSVGPDQKIEISLQEL